MVLVLPLADVQFHGAEGADEEPLVLVEDVLVKGVLVEGVLVEGVLVKSVLVPQDPGIAEEGEVGHVLRAVNLVRVDLADSLRLVLTFTLSLILIMKGAFWM